MPLALMIEENHGRLGWVSVGPLIPLDVSLGELLHDVIRRPYGKIRIYML